MIDNEYFRVHNWLIYYHGRAVKCENKDCNYPNPKRYEWALKKGCKYERNIDNYIQLCPSCHRKYDFTQETRDKISKARKGLEANNAVCVILNDDPRYIYSSMKKAGIAHGICFSAISNNISGRSKKTRKGIWKIYKPKA